MDIRGKEDLVRFTSDQHFNHFNIIEYTKRPFKTLHEMNNVLIENWNSVVSVNDIVFHLGDLAFKNGEIHLSRLVKKLNGRIILIKGNHDASTKFLLDCGIEGVYKSLALETKYGQIYLSHKPYSIKVGDLSLIEPPIGFDYHFCGHVHEKWQRVKNVINVGVDQWNYRPIIFEEIMGK